MSPVLIYGCDSNSGELEKSEIVIPSSNYSEIKANLDKLVISKVESNAIRKGISDKYKYINSSEGDYNLLNETTVYLYYEGLDSGGIWDKAGAKAFGGLRIATISFSNGPVEAKVLAHKELEGGRNYFYVITDNKIEGWMGRPYIHKDKEGSKFLMSNPLTGETVRKYYEIPSSFVVDELKHNAPNYIPSYESIVWDSSIPQNYREKGYELYKNALSDGHAEVDRIVSEYLMTH